MLRTDRMISLLLLATSLLPTTAHAGKPPQNTPVTSTFTGFGVDTIPIMRVQSDQLGPYANSSTVVSIIQGSGDWELLCLDKALGKQVAHLRATLNLESFHGTPLSSR